VRNRPRARLNDREAQKDRVVIPARREATLAGGMAEAVNAAIGNIKGKFGNEDMKGSIGDLIRLLQLRKELTDTQPKQVTVRWIDECQTKPENEE